MFTRRSLTVAACAVFVALSAPALKAQTPYGQTADAAQPRVTPQMQEYAQYYLAWVRQYRPQLSESQARMIASALPYYLQVVLFYNKNLVDVEATVIAYHVLEKSYQFNVDPRLVMGLISVESRFKPKAVSRSGARGLGQLMPGTAKYLGVSNSFDHEQNIYGTVKYIREQLDKFRYSAQPLTFALAAYNAGPKAVEKYGGVPPYRETKNYVVKVSQIYNHLCSGCVSRGSGVGYAFLQPGR